MEGVYACQLNAFTFLDLDHSFAMSIESTMSTPLPQPETFMEKAKRKIREEPLVTAGTDKRSLFLAQH